MSKIAVIKDIEHSVSYIGVHSPRLTPGQLVEIYRKTRTQYAVYATIEDYNINCGWMVPHASIKIIGEL